MVLVHINFDRFILDHSSWKILNVSLSLVLHMSGKLRDLGAVSVARRFSRCVKGNSLFCADVKGNCLLCADVKGNCSVLT